MTSLGRQQSTGVKRPETALASISGPRSSSRSTSPQSGTRKSHSYKETSKAPKLQTAYTLGEQTAESGLSQPSESNANRRKSIGTVGVNTTNGGQKESGDANGTILRRALNPVSHGHSPEISDAKATFAPEISDGDTSKWRMAASAPRSSGSTKWYEELAALKDSERALCFMGCTDQDVEHFCRTCSVDMCSMCGTKHTTDKKTRSHVLISYQEKKEPYCLHITTLYMEKKHLTFGFGEHISVKFLALENGGWNVRMLKGFGMDDDATARNLTKSFYRPPSAFLRRTEEEEFQDCDAALSKGFSSMPNLRLRYFEDSSHGKASLRSHSYNKFVVTGEPGLGDFVKPPSRPVGPFFRSPSTKNSKSPADLDRETSETIGEECVEDAEVQRDRCPGGDSHMLDQTTTAILTRIQDNVRVWSTPDDLGDSVWSTGDDLGDTGNFFDQFDSLAVRRCGRAYLWGSVKTFDAETAAELMEVKRNESADSVREKHKKGGKKEKESQIRLIASSDVMKSQDILDDFKSQSAATNRDTSEASESLQAATSALFKRRTIPSWASMRKLTITAVTSGMNSAGGHTRDNTEEGNQDEDVDASPSGEDARDAQISRTASGGSRNTRHPAPLLLTEIERGASFVDYIPKEPLRLTRPRPATSTVRRPRSSKPKPETYTLNKVGRASWGEVKNEGSSTESTPSFPLSETKIGKDWKGLCAYTQSLPILSRHSTLKSPRNPWARGGKRLVTAGSTPAVTNINETLDDMTPNAKTMKGLLYVEHLFMDDPVCCCWCQVSSKHLMISGQVDPERVMYKVHLLDLVVEKCSVSRRRLLLVSIKATNKEIVNSYATGLKQQFDRGRCVLVCKDKQDVDAWLSRIRVLQNDLNSEFSRQTSIEEKKEEAKIDEDDLKCADGLNSWDYRPGRTCWLRNLSSLGPLGAYNGKQCVVGDRDSVNDKISVQITNGKEVKNIKVNIENLCTVFPRMPLSDKETKKLDDTMQRFRDWLEHLYGGKELPAEHVDDEELDFAPDLRLDPKKSEKDKRRNTWAVLDPPDP